MSNNSSSRIIGGRFLDTGITSGIYDINDVSNIQRDSGLNTAVNLTYDSQQVLWTGPDKDPYRDQVIGHFQSWPLGAQGNLLEDLSIYDHVIHGRGPWHKAMVKNGGPKLYHSLQCGDQAYSIANLTTAELQESVYTTPGTYTWVCPSGVTSVNAVCIGGGAGQVTRNFNAADGGGGGGLGWANSIAVTPGNSYTVVVGAGGTADNVGGTSYFINTTTVRGGGGGVAGNMRAAGVGGYAGSYETMTYTATGTVTLTNNGTTSVNMFKLTGSNAWDAQVYSTVGFTAPCTIEFNKQADSANNQVSAAMIGWNIDPTTNASNDSLDYAAYPIATSAYRVFNNGSTVLSSGPAWNSAQKLYIVYDTDGYIRHYNGSTLLYSVNYGTGKTVYLDSSYYSQGATYAGFSNVRIMRASWNGSVYTTPTSGGGNGGIGGLNTYNGGTAGGSAGGGGGGGYTGNGGAGGEGIWLGTPGNPGNGGGGGGGGGSVFTGSGGGGGTGLYGEGPSGIAGVGQDGGGGGSTDSAGGGLTGFSGGDDGSGANGGKHGGGAGGKALNYGSPTTGVGASGGVRIFWSTATRTIPALPTYYSKRLGLTLDTASFTIQFWTMLHRNHATEHYILGRGGQAGRGSGTGWVVYITSTYQLGFYDAVANVSYTTTTAMVRDRWYHVAIVRNGTSLNVYINGTSESSGTCSSNFNDANTAYIGRDRTNNTSTYFGGKLCDLKITKVAEYTGNFTRPSSPISSSNALYYIGPWPWHPTSPNIQEGSVPTTLTGDYMSMVPITPYDTTHSSSRWGAVGCSSVAINYDYYLHVRSHVSLNFGTGTFTIECWITNNTYGGDLVIVSKGTGARATAGATGWGLRMDSAGRLEWFTGASVISTTNLNERVAPHCWGHVACVREGTGTNQLKLYVNGQLAGQGTDSSNYSDSQFLNIGCARDQGYAASREGICGLRISKGIARYTGTFTVNTTTFFTTSTTNDSYVSLLTFIKPSAILDRNTGQPGWKNEGWDPQLIQSHYEGYRKSCYTVVGRNGLYGHSTWFNGSQARVIAQTTASTTNDFNFGTGDFTIEFWKSNGRSQLDGDTYYVLFDSRATMNDSGIAMNEAKMTGLEVWSGGNVILSSPHPASIIANQWKHICVQRRNNQLALYVNGVKRDEVTYSGSITSPNTNRFVIGNGSYSSIRYGNGWWGFISNFRIVKGTAVYSYGTSNVDKFTVPSQPLTAITNTVLLTCCGPNHADYSGRNNNCYTGAIPGTQENLTSAWSAYAGVEYTPFSPTTDFDLRNYLIQHTGAPSTSWWGLWDNYGYNHGGLSPSLGFIQRFSSNWTVECWFYLHEQDPAAPSAQRVLRTCGDTNEPGFAFHQSMNSAGSSSRLDVCFDIRTGSATNRLGSTGNTGNLIPHGINHAAIVYDSTKTNKMAIFVNGRRVANTTTALAASPIWYTQNSIQTYYNCGPVRISNTARYDPDTTSITLPTNWSTADQFDALLVKSSGGFFDKSLQNSDYLDSMFLDNNFKATTTSSGSIYLGGHYNTRPPRLWIHNPEYWVARLNTTRQHDFTIEMWACWHDAASGGSAIPTGPNSEGACLIHVRNWVWVGLMPSGVWNLTLKNANNATTYLRVTTTVTGATKTNNRFDHVVLQRQGRNYTLFINGVHVAKVPVNNHGGGYTSGYTWNSDQDMSWGAEGICVIGSDWGNLTNTAWAGWIEDVRFTKTSRYESKSINGVATMVHKDTIIPALPTGPYPSN